MTSRDALPGCTFTLGAWNEAERRRVRDINTVHLTIKFICYLVYNIKDMKLEPLLHQ